MKSIGSTGLAYLWEKIKSYVSGLGFYTKPSTGIPASDMASGVIPTVPTSLSAFTDDLGSSPTHTHSQYLTSAPVTSVNGQTGAVSLTIPDVSGKADKVVVVNAATLPASLEPNKVYQMGTLTGSVTIPAFASIAAGDTEAKIWCFTFNTSTTAPTIVWPAGIVAWNGGDAPTINADASYEVTVMDGIGVIIEA